MSTQNPQQPRVVIVLVHGTVLRVGRFLPFGKSLWTKEGSVFRRGAETLVGCSVRIEEFEWSGDNSHSARMTAAGDLVKYIKILSQQCPNSILYIVAHSHGGNVALYALKMLSNSGEDIIAGVVTLGTPFIHIQKRELGEIRSNLVSCVNSGLACWCIIVATLLSYNLLIYRLDPILAILLIISMIIVVFGFTVKKILDKYQLSDWENEAKLLESSLCALCLSGTSILCLKANRDEASLWVKFIDGINRLFFGNWQIDIVAPLVNTWQLIADKEFMSIARVLWQIIRIGKLWPLAIILVVVYFAAAIGFPALSLVAILFIVMGTSLTTSAPWGFGQKLVIPWLVDIWIEDEPMRFFRETKHSQAGLISLGLSVPRDHSASGVSKLRNQPDFGEVRLITAQEFGYKNLSLHHSDLCFDLRVIESIAGFITKQLRTK